MTTDFHVLLTCGAFEPGFRGGGPIRSIAQVIDTAPADIAVTMVTSDRDIGSATPYPGLSGQWRRRGNARIFYLDTRSIRQWVRLLWQLRKTKFDLLYVNSLWAPTTTIAPVIASRLRLLKASRLLVAPRGELSGGALAIKSRKKELVLPWWRRVLRSMDAEWHATADHEVADIRAHFPWARVEMNPNQTALPPEPLPVARSQHPHARLVFISRISASKRLDVALRALQHVTEPVDLDIYGPIEDRAYWAVCEGLISTMPVNVDVCYRGELAPADVRTAFAGYDAFLFPTSGENFGHAIAESLSAGCPVITSRATPWTSTLQNGGGRALADVGVETLAAAVRALTAMTAEDRFRDRLSAAEAYRSWRQTTVNTNILDRARGADMAGQR